MAKKDNYSIDDILNEYSVDDENATSHEKSEIVNSILLQEDASENNKILKEIKLTKKNGSFTENTADPEPDREARIRYEAGIESDNSYDSTGGINLRTDKRHIIGQEKNSDAKINLEADRHSLLEAFRKSEQEISDEQDDDSTDDEKPVSLKTKFIDRSATRILDKPNMILHNPQDNIRYVKKVSDNFHSQSYKVKAVKKKKAKEPPETKSDLKNLEVTSKKSEKESASVYFFDAVSNFKANLRAKTSDIFKTKGVTEKESKINIKSVPDIGFFSIDIDINENPQQSEKKNKKGFKDVFGDMNKNFTNANEHHIDDYNSPGDASIILDDLYNLKSNLTAKFVVQLFAALISIYMTAAPLYNLPMIKSINPELAPHTYSFIMFLISAIVLFSSFSVITSGLKNIFHKKADCDSLVSLSLIISTLAAAVSTENTVLIQSKSIFIFTPVAITGFLINTIGKHMIVNRAINNFDMLISSKAKHAMIYIDDETKAQQLTKGIISDYPILTTTKKTNFASDFLKYTYSSDLSDRFCKTAVPVIIFFSIFMTIINVFFYHNSLETISPSFITYSLALFVSTCTCFGIPIIINLPLSSVAENAEENESLILGYQSIDDFYDTNSIMLDSTQIFPEHTIKLTAIKIFSDTKIDDAIIAAASLAHCSGSIFFSMFNKIINSNLSLLERVENYSYEDSMGLCGWINNKRILLGTRQLMINHNIEGMPPKSKEKDLVGKEKIAVYLSISGNLAAMYVIKLKTDQKISDYLNSIIDNNISLIIKSIDSVTTITRISRMFDIPEDMIKIIPSELHEYYNKTTAPVPKVSASVICNGTLSSISKVISNIKSIYQSSLTGIVLQSTSAIIAILITLVFLFLGAINNITPLMMLLYNIIWTLITIFIMKVRPK